MKKYSSFINEGKKSDKDIIHSALLEYVDGVGYNWNYITPEELNKEDLRDFYLLDIRSKEDYEEGHITDAKNIFWKDLLKEENIKKLPKKLVKIYTNIHKDNCVICLEHLVNNYKNLIILTCGHSYHLECYNKVNKCSMCF